MSKAEAFEVNFADNKSIGVNVNFSKGDAIQVPVSINSLDAEKVAKEVGDRIAEKLDETALANVAKEQTLLMESQRIQDEVRNIDLSSIENKVKEVKQAVENIDLSPIKTKVDEGVATLSTKIDNIDLSAIENKVQEESAAIQAKIDNIELPEIDTSALAKQGENQDATNTAIYALLSQFGNSVLQEKVTVVLNCQENIVWKDYAVNVTFEDGRTQAVPLSESGTCTFSIKIGQNYSVQLPVIGVFITPALQTYTAITSSRDIYWSYLTTGVFGLDELGRRYSIEQIEALEDKSIIKYAGFTNNELENSLRADGTRGNGFMWDLNNYIIGPYQWSTSNAELDTNLMPIVTPENIANFADGAACTRNLILATSQANLSSPAALQCSSQSITIGNEQKKGFLIGPYQYHQFLANYSSVQLLYNTLGIAFPDNFKTSTYYCTSGQGEKSPIFSYVSLNLRYNNVGFSSSGVKTDKMKCFCVFQL